MNSNSCYQIGCVVHSTAGRDKDRTFIIVSVLDEQYVLIADGVTHKLASPKKKKIKHVRSCGAKIENIAAKLTEGKKVFDSEVRKSLEEYSQSTHKEG